MQLRNIAIFTTAALAGLIAGSAIGPRPAEAVARELIEMQRDVSTLLQGQKDMQSQMTQDHTVMKTLVEQSGDNVGKLNSTMSSPPEVRPGRAGQFRRAPRHYVHPGPGPLGQSRGN